MPLPGIRAAKSFLDELQRDLLETEDQDFDGLLDRWSALGVPEIDEYRGERRRSRGELISEVSRTLRAIEKRPDLLQEEEAGETPILTGARRIARGAEVLQGLMERAATAQPFSAKSNVNGQIRPASTGTASPAAGQESVDFEAKTGDSSLPATAGPEAGGRIELALPPGAPSQTGNPATAQAASVALPGGAIAYRPSARPSSVTLPNVAGGLGRVLSRVASGVGVGLTTMLTPWNDQGRYFHFGEDGQSRFLLARGDLHGIIEERDPSTGEWRATDRIGMFVRGPGDDESTILTGTPEQVAAGFRQIMTPLNSPSPREAMDPPPFIPGMTEPESFPAEKQGPEVEIFPATPQEPDIEIFPIPETPQVQAEVFLALSDEVIRELTRPLEAHRGDAFTRRGTDIVVQKTYEVLRRWFPEVGLKQRFSHEAGATEFGDGDKLKERFVRDPITNNYSIPDIIIKDTDDGRLIALNTGKTLKDGQTLIAAERDQLERLRKNLGPTGAGGGLPKLRPGMDETVYATQVEEQLTEFFTGYFGKPPVR